MATSPPENHPAPVAAPAADDIERLERERDEALALLRDAKGWLAAFNPNVSEHGQEAIGRLLARIDALLAKEKK